MNRGRTLGGVLGLATLATIFLLPFSNVAEGPNGSTDTLYAIFNLFVTTFSNVQSIGLATIIDLAYAYIIATVLLFVAGVIGVRPLASAILGLIGMGTATISPFFIFTSYTWGSTTYGVGFWALWVVPILSIFAGYWSRKEARRGPTTAGASPTAPSQSGGATA